jgi:hypothetical protein
MAVNFVLNLGANRGRVGAKGSGPAGESRPPLSVKIDAGQGADAQRRLHENFVPSPPPCP